MRNYKRTTTAGAAVLVLAVMLTVSACGANGNDTEQNGNDSALAGVNDQLPEESGIQDPGAISSDDDTEQVEETATTEEGGDAGQPADAVISSEGVYTGQIDANSIEIKTDSGAEAYRITEELAPVIEALPSDAEVVFEYTEKDIDGAKQLWLTKIEAKS